MRRSWDGPSAFLVELAGLCPSSTSMFAGTTRTLSPTPSKLQALADTVFVYSRGHRLRTWAISELFLVERALKKPANFAQECSTTFPLSTTITSIFGRWVSSENDRCSPRSVAAEPTESVRADPSATLRGPQFRAALLKDLRSAAPQANLWRLVARRVSVAEVFVVLTELDIIERVTSAGVRRAGQRRKNCSASAGSFSCSAASSASSRGRGSSCGAAGVAPQSEDADGKDEVLLHLWSTFVRDAILGQDRADIIELFFANPMLQQLEDVCGDDDEDDDDGDDLHAVDHQGAGKTKDEDVDDLISRSVLMLSGGRSSAEKEPPCLQPPFFAPLPPSALAVARSTSSTHDPETSTVLLSEIRAAASANGSPETKAFLARVDKIAELGERASTFVGKMLQAIGEEGTPSAREPLAAQSGATKRTRETRSSSRRRSTPSDVASVLASSDSLRTSSANKKEERLERDSIRLGETQNTDKDRLEREHDGFDVLAQLLPESCCRSSSKKHGRAGAEEQALYAEFFQNQKRIGRVVAEACSVIEDIKQVQWQARDQTQRLANAYEKCVAAAATPGPTMTPAWLGQQQKRTFALLRGQQQLPTDVGDLAELRGQQLPTDARDLFLFPAIGLKRGRMKEHGAMEIRSLKAAFRNRDGTAALFLMGCLARQIRLSQASVENCPSSQQKDLRKAAQRGGIVVLDQGGGGGRGIQHHASTAGGRGDHDPSDVGDDRLARWRDITIAKITTSREQDQMNEQSQRFCQERPVEFFLLAALYEAVVGKTRPPKRGSIFYVRRGR